MNNESTLRRLVLSGLIKYFKQTGTVLEEYKISNNLFFFCIVSIHGKEHSACFLSLILVFDQESV